jgi:AcrR family transcriptional regulator
MPKKKDVEISLSTEEKIKAAAQRVFMKKGFAATRTRDIAQEAGINLALLNYYFRSKEKLFDIIMLEKLAKFFGGVAPVLNETETSLEQKIILLSNNYIDLLIANPELPIFILSEVRTHPERFVSKIPVARVVDSHFIKQLQERKPDVHPLHFLMNILGLSVFPFIMKPVFHASGILNEKSFIARMEERKMLIPKWINAMLKHK